MEKRLSMTLPISMLVNLFNLADLLSIKIKIIKNEIMVIGDEGTLKSAFSSQGILESYEKYIN